MPTADEIRLALTLYGTEETVLRDPDDATRKAIDGLSAAGLLDETKPGEFEGNEALTMWVEALALVPFPILKWVLPPYGSATGGVKAYED